MEDDLNSLITLCERIPQLKLSVRGTGKARFVYARTEHRAVELSVASPGFFCEGWNQADEESEEPAAISQQLQSIQEVEIWLRQWLK